MDGILLAAGLSMLWTAAQTPLNSDSPLHGQERTFLRLPKLRRRAWPLAGQVRILRRVEHAGRRGHRRGDAGLDPLQTQAQAFRAGNIDRKEPRGPPPAFRNGRA